MENRSKLEKKQVKKAKIEKKNKTQKEKTPVKAPQIELKKRSKAITIDETTFREIVQVPTRNPAFTISESELKKLRNKLHQTSQSAPASPTLASTQGRQMQGFTQQKTRQLSPPSVLASRVLTDSSSDIDETKGSSSNSDSSNVPSPVFFRSNLSSGNSSDNSPSSALKRSPGMRNLLVSIQKPANEHSANESTASQPPIIEKTQVAVTEVIHDELNPDVLPENYLGRSTTSRGWAKITAEKKSQVKKFSKRFDEADKIYNQGRELLGLESKPTISFTSSEKITGFLRIFVRLADIDQESRKDNKNFSYDILVELMLWQKWLQDETKFTQEDRACLNAMSQKAEENKDFALLEKLKMMQAIIFGKHTDYMLKNILLYMQCLSYMDSKDIQKLSLENSKTQSNTAMQDHCTKLTKKHVHASNNIYLDTQSEVSSLNETSNPSISTTDQAQKSAAKQPRPLNNHFVNLKKYVEICDSAYKSFLSLCQQSSITMYYTSEDKDQHAISAYKASEMVIRIANAILQDKNLSQSERANLSGIIYYHFQVNQDVLKKSKALQDELSTENAELSLATDIVKKVKFANLSAKVHSKEKKPIPEIELEFLKKSLKKITHRPNLEVVLLGGNNSFVYLITDKGKDGNSTPVNVIVRSVEVLVSDERDGKTPDKTRIDVTGSLDCQMTTRQFYLVPGQIENLTHSENNPERKRRDYEVSQALPNSKHLFNEFLSLHAAHTKSKEPNALLRFQLSAIHYVLALTQGSLEFAMFNICNGDCKPDNVITMSKPISKRQKEISRAEEIKKTIKISDVKGYIKPMPEYENKPYNNDVPQRSRGYFSENVVVGVDEHRIINLQTLHMQTLVFTINELLTLSKHPTTDYETHLKYLEAVLDENAPASVFPPDEMITDSKQEVERTKAIAMADIFQGTLGPDMRAICGWLIKLYKGEIGMEAIIEYFKQPLVQARLKMAEHQLNQGVRNEETEKLTMH